VTCLLTVVCCRHAIRLSVFVVTYIISFCDSVDQEGDTAEWTVWLRINSHPETKVLQLWSKTAKSRLSFIHIDKPNMNDIISEWPRYGDEKGYILASTE
jgi:hypothetical protein